MTLPHLVLEPAALAYGMEGDQEDPACSVRDYASSEYNTEILSVTLCEAIVTASPLNMIAFEPCINIFDQ